jgi:hypothetical protein
MTRRKVVLLCFLGLALVGGVVLTLRSPSFWVREGMTYDEVEGVLGRQLNGIRPVSLVDDSWTGRWLGSTGIIEVTFDSRDRVRESPSLVRRVLDWIGL